MFQDDTRNLDRYERYASEFGTYGVFRLDEGGVVRHHSRDWLAELTRTFMTIHQAYPEVVTMNGHRATSYQWIGRKP